MVTQSQEPEPASSGTARLGQRAAAAELTGGGSPATADVWDTDPGAGNDSLEIGTVLIFDNKGKAKQKLKAEFASALTGDAARFRGHVNADTLAALKYALQSMARRHKLGAQGVALMVGVLDAWAAPTTAERRVLLAAMPVAKIVTPFPGGQRRDYYVKGVLKLRMISGPAVEQEPTDSVAFAVGTLGPDFEPESGETAIHSDRFVVAIPEDCQYTDAWNVYTEGECATQEDLDEMATTVAAPDYDTENLQTEYGTAQAEYCDFHNEPETCEWAYDDADADLSLLDSVATEEDGSTAPASAFGAAAVPCPEMAPDGTLPNCAMEGASAIVAMGGMLFARMASHSILGAGTAARVTATAVTATVGGYIVASVGLGLALGVAIHCFIT